VVNTWLERESAEKYGFPSQQEAVSEGNINKTQEN
jgi:hypothetical protein